MKRKSTLTLDFTYLDQLTVTDLLNRAREHNDNGLIRALADRLEEHIDALADYDNLNAELLDANQRAESWREEAMALQRQLDMVRG